MSKKSLIVMRKEIVDNIRDRRSLFSSLLLPILYPVLLGGAFFMTGKKLDSSQKKPLKLVVAGAAHAPGLVSYLQDNRVQITREETGLRRLVKKGKYKVGLVIPPDFIKLFRSAKPAKLRVIMDSSRRWDRKYIGRLYRLLAVYGRKIGNLRLVARGIHPQIVHPFAIQKDDVATPEGRSAMILSVLPMLMLIVVFMGGLYIAIDTTAGEFERGSLEPLLINPISRFELILGKYLATLTFSALGLLITVLGFGLLPFFLSTEKLGFQVHLSPLVLGKVFLLCLPLAMLASGLQMLLATFSKSFKEAQSRLSMFVLLPMIPGMYLSFSPMGPTLWAMLVPTLGEQILINSLMRGDVVPMGYFITSMLVTTLFAGACLWAATRLYIGERLFLRR